MTKKNLFFSCAYYYGKFVMNHFNLKNVKSMIIESIYKTFDRISHNKALNSKNIQTNRVRQEIKRSVFVYKYFIDYQRFHGYKI